MAARWGPALALAPQIVEFANGQSDPTYRLLIATIRAAIEANHRSGTSMFNSVAISQLVEAALKANDLAGAEVARQEGLAFVEQSGERLWLAEFHRLEGRIALERGEPDQGRAETCFRRAIEITHGQEARMLALRAATDPAQLWRDTDSDRDPRAIGPDPRCGRGGRDHARYP